MTNSAFTDFTNTQAFVNATPLSETQVVKSFDDFMNNVVVGGFDKAMTAATAYAGDKLGEAASKGSQVISERVDNVSAKVTGDKELAKDTPQIQKEVGAPDISQNQSVANAMSAAGLKWPPDVQGQTAVHVDNADLSKVAQSSLTTGLGGQVQTNSQGLSV